MIILSLFIKLRCISHRDRSAIMQGHYFGKVEGIFLSLDGVTANSNQNGIDCAYY